MLHLDDSNFDMEISAGITLIDFYADWCSPCRVYSKVFDKVAGLFENVKFAKVDIENCQKSTKDYKIDTIPATLLFRDGKLIFSWRGVVREEVLYETLRMQGGLLV